MRTATQWLEDYGDSHRNAANKALHWICVPVIAWCVLGLAVAAALSRRYSRNVPRRQLGGCRRARRARCITRVLSPRLALGAAPLLLAFLWSINGVARWSTVPLWGVCLFLFVAAWIGQFIGHAIEGKRPSFFKDLQFLMIGPLWLLADVYRRLGIRI